MTDASMSEREVLAPETPFDSGDSMLLLLASIAQSLAADHHIEMGVYAKPVGPRGGAWAEAGSTMRFADVLSDAPQVAVPSTWDPVTCEVDGDDVVVRFAPDPANWPASYPATATCSYGSDSLVVHLVPAHPHVEAFFSGQDWVLDVQQGVEYTMGAESSAVRLFELPGGPSYGTHKVQALLQPNVLWPGVYCLVMERPGDTPILAVNFFDEAPEGEGMCPVPNDGPMPFYLPVKLIKSSP